MSEPTVLVVGASRGLGLALAEEWLKRGRRVIATTRAPSPGLEALASSHGDRLELERVDIAQAPSVRSLASRLSGRVIDVLFVNAGIAKANDRTPGTADEQDFLDMMLTNALAPVRMVEVLEDRVPADGVIAVMTSELGSVANGSGFWPLYSSSKAALNMLMKGFAARRPNDPRALLLVAPGWVRTDMGGPEATFSIEESIPRVVDMVEANRGRPGLRFLDRFDRALPW